MHKKRRGLTIFFTGLSGAGKSTIASEVLLRLDERCDQSVTLLDGDIVRKILSSELGYSREHRDIILDSSVTPHPKQMEVTRELWWNGSFVTLRQGFGPRCR